MDENEYVVGARAYVESGQMLLVNSFGGTNVMQNKEMIALELCPHGDLFSLVSEHHPFLQENQQVTKNLIG